MNTASNPTACVAIYSKYGREYECLAKNGSKEARRLEAKYGIAHVVVTEENEADVVEMLAARTAKMEKNVEASNARSEAKFATKWTAIEKMNSDISAALEANDMSKFRALIAERAAKGL